MNPTFINMNEQILQNHAHLLEGVSHYTNDARQNELERNRIAIMLDNAEKEGCRKLGISAKELREAQTSTGSSVSFVKTQFPLIRKIYPNMISRELVSTQTMSQPTMKVFYYDIQRDDTTSLSADIHNQRTYADNVEYDPDSPTAIKEIVLKITGSDVSAVEKKLKAKWTPEAEQDIFAYHGISVANDLMGALGAELTREWDRKILAELLAGATGGTATFDQTVPAGLTYTDRKVWMETLYEKMIDVDTAIYKKTYKKTNWVVFPAEVAGFIEKMAGFRADATSIDTKIIASGGRYFMGTLNNRWRCYCDPFFPSNKILMGYNNPGDWMDTAYVFCPYILAYFSDEFLNPDTMQKTRSVLSRAASFLCRPDLLGYISISGS